VFKFRMAELHFDGAQIRSGFESVRIPGPPPGPVVPGTVTAGLRSMPHGMTSLKKVRDYCLCESSHSLACFICGRLLSACCQESRKSR
jgi:hypothetical protein